MRMFWNRDRGGRGERFEGDHGGHEHGRCGHDHDHGHRGHGRRHMRGGDGFSRGHHRHGGGRRGGRLFDHGDLRLVILQMIAEKPRHGYEIIKAIEERVGGAYSPSPGVIYPTLTMLEELGHAAQVASDDAKKLYAITPEGEAFIAANKPAMDAVRARIDQAKAAYGDGPAPAILRAMENLKLALRLRLGRGPLSQTEIDTIAATLDAAAQQVERT